MKKLPLGIQNFNEIITGDYIYVDKTKYIYRLINDAKYIFLSRPRRFGKSLLLDTIAEIFNGDKELFVGLWIHDSGYAFKKHPVVRFDMSGTINDSPEILKQIISEDIIIRAAKDGINLVGNEPGVLFKRLIESLFEKYGERIVVLIDEYDKPILDHINDVETAARNRSLLGGFYGVLKSLDAYLRFVFITGVTKFTKTAIFSGLNNLKDITLSEDYAGICGIPTDSLDEYFGGYIGQMSTDKRLKKYASIKDEILAWYDGYSWDGESKLLNPFSLLNSFSDRKFKRYWYATGTPSFLIEMIKKKPESYLRLKNLQITEDMLDTFEIERIELEPLLFQTGYLTIKEAADSLGPPVYTLDMPNYEVRDAFSTQIVSALTDSGDVRASQAKLQIGAALESGDLQKMLEILRGRKENI